MDPEQGPQDQNPQQSPREPPPYSPQYPQQGQYPPAGQYPQQGQYPPPGQYPPQQQPPGPPRRDEKGDEKQGEKEQEKQQEKGRNLDEKYHHNPVGFVIFAILVIWLGVTLLLQNADIIDSSDQGWAIFLWGGGIIILIGALVRLLVPRYRRPVGGSFVWAAIWIGVGFGLYYDKWEIIGPLIIIAIGVAILLGRLVPRR
jgi:hypothetical protein